MHVLLRLPQFTVIILKCPPWLRWYIIDKTHFNCRDQKSWFVALKVYPSIPVIRVGKLVYINTRYTRPADRFSELFIEDRHRSMKYSGRLSRLLNCRQVLASRHHVYIMNGSNLDSIYGVGVKNLPNWNCNCFCALLRTFKCIQHALF